MYEFITNVHDSRYTKLLKYLFKNLTAYNNKTNLCVQFLEI